MKDWQKKFFFCQVIDSNHFTWNIEKLKDEVTDLDFGDLELAIDKMGHGDELFSEVKLTSTGLSPYDPATSVAPVKDEASLCVLQLPFTHSCLLLLFFFFYILPC